MTFDNDLFEVERTNYTILDMVSQVGGLFVTLMMIGQFALSFIVRIDVSLENHLIEGVFRKRANPPNLPKSMQKTDRPQKLRINYCHWL